MQLRDNVRPYVRNMWILHQLMHSDQFWIIMLLAGQRCMYCVGTAPAYVNIHAVTYMAAQHRSINAMASVPIPNCVMVEHIFTMHGQRIENVYHVDAGHPATASDLVDILDVFDDWDNTWHRTQRVSNCALTLQVATALDGSGAPFLERPLTPARAGAIGGGEAFPSQVTVAVKLSTGLAGRSFRGRSFFCGLARAATSGDAINPANITAIVNIYDALRTTLAAAGF